MAPVIKNLVSREAADVKHFSGEASNLFSSYRIPAMLIAGAAYGGAWALPLSTDEEFVKQLAKRTYMIVSLGTIMAELLVTVVSTIAIEKMSVISASNRTPTVDFRSYIQTNLDLEWAAARVNFLFGLVGFALMCGMRVWISMSCPAVGKEGLALILTSITFMIALMSDVMSTECNGVNKDRPGFRKLFSCYIGNLLRKARQGHFWFILTAVLGVITFSYTAWAYRHVVNYVAAAGIASTV